MKRLIFSIFLSVLPFIMYAVHPIVRNFDRKEYKSGTQNWAITQDNDNIMYFANNNGMLVFDGKKWTTIPIKNGTNVRDLLFDGKKRFYASTFNEFGYFERGEAGQMLYYSLSDSLTVKALGSNELYNIHLDKNNVYFQGDKTIFRYDGKKLRELSFQSKIDVSAVVHNVLFVTVKEDGLFLLNGNMFVKVPGSEALVNKKVVEILPYGTNKVLLITAFNAVFVYDGVSVQSYSTPIDGFLKTNQVFCAASNGEKIVYGTVQRGIVVQDLKDESIVFVNSFTGMQNNTVLSVAFDNMQNLWLGLDKGIDYVLLNSPIANLFGTNKLYGSGYTSLIRKNKIYFGTNQGLYSSNYPILNEPIPLQLNLVKGMEGQVWCLKEIDNTLFCGDDQGAFIVSPNKVERISSLTGTWNFKQLRNHPDLILGCSYQGLFILKKSNSSWKFSHFIKGDFKESSPLFEEDDDGSIWFSHWQKGLFRLTLNQNIDSIVKVDVYDQDKGLPGMQNNTMFRVAGKIVFSSERGFYSYDKKTDKMLENSQWNDLFSSAPSYLRLHESPSGNVWCVSGSFIGLARKSKDNTFEMDSLSFRMLQSKIIVGFEHFNFVDNDELIISTEDGFSKVDMNPMKTFKSNFKVLMTSIIALNDKSPNHHFKVTVPAFDDIYSFKSNFNNLRFVFNAPEYRNDDLVEYSFKLDGLDQNWSEYGSDFSKEYTQLARGNYVFRVRARDLLEFREAETAFEFEILPAWYETNLAFAIYFILFVLLIVGLVIFVNHRSKKGAEQMKNVKEKEIQEQKKVFEEDSKAKKKEIKELKNQQLQYELRHKSQELASSTMNLIRKNEILLEIVDTINKTSDDIKKDIDSDVLLKRLKRVERNIRQNIENDNNWKRFEENFDLVYENYLTRLGEAYPNLNVTDKKICAYVKMNLSSKDMAPLLNMSVRSIETNRYRVRKKMNLEREVNLSEFLQKF